MIAMDPTAAPPSSPQGRKFALDALLTRLGDFAQNASRVGSEIAEGLRGPASEAGANMESAAGRLADVIGEAHGLVEGATGTASAMDAVIREVTMLVEEISNVVARIGCLRDELNLNIDGLPNSEDARHLILDARAAVSEWKKQDEFPNGTGKPRSHRLNRVRMKIKLGRKSE